MRRRVPFLIALLTFVSFVAPLDAENKLRARLDSGEIIVKTKKVKGSDVPQATVMGVVNAPPEKIWDVIGKCDNYEETMIRVLEAKELKRKGDTVICQVTTDMPWPLSNLTAVTRAHHTVGPPVWSRTWALIQGDFESNRGSWRIQAFNPVEKDRSLVVYKVHAVPDIMVPDGLITKAQKDTLPNLIKHLRKNLE